MAWEPLVNYSTIYPPYSLMQRAYEDYRINSRPAGAFPKNQCAVRMSIALGRCGFALDTLPKNLLQTNSSLPFPYILLASELAKYLKKFWGNPVIFVNNLELAARSLYRKTGVIYFQDCFQREGDPEGSRNGDHIDLWNGYRYYNQIYNLRAGMEDQLSSGSLFARSKMIWFYGLD